MVPVTGHRQLVVTTNVINRWSGGWGEIQVSFNLAVAM